jgi:protein-histidine pros-kinase
MIMGIRGKTIFLIGIMGLLSIGMMGYFSYRFSKDIAIDEAKSKSQLVLNYVHSTRKYLKNVQRPLVMELIEQDRFYPELMSGFVVARGTYDIFKTQLPGYRFKQATIDPLFPGNQADSNETALIQTFHDTPAIKQHEGTVEKDGELFYYIAEPIRVDNEKCLKCH